MNSESPMLLVGVGTAGCAIARGVGRAFGGNMRCLLADTDATSGEGGGTFTLLGGDSPRKFVSPFSFPNTCGNAL